MGDEEGQNEAESDKERKESCEMTDASKKIIRVITVTTYLFSVSMAAITLSLYYLFFWNPTVQSGSQRLVDPIQLHFSGLYFNVTQKESIAPKIRSLRQQRLISHVLHYPKNAYQVPFGVSSSSKEWHLKLNNPSDSSCGNQRTGKYIETIGCRVGGHDLVTHRTATVALRVGK